nr:VP6 protein [Hubei lepidoptera virus 3]
MNRLIAYAEYTELTLKNLEKINKNIMGLLSRDCAIERNEKERKEKLQKEVIGGKSSLDLLVKPGNVFPLIKDGNREPLSVLNELRFAFADQEIESEIVEGRMMGEVIRDARLNILLELIILGDGKKEIIDCINEILLGGDNVIIIFEGQNRAIKVRGNIGNEFVVIYYDGVTLFEIDASKELTETLFVGECVNGRRMKKDCESELLRKRMITVHAYDYVTEKVRQWLIPSNEEERKIALCNALLEKEDENEKRRVSLEINGRKVFPDERNITHGIFKIYKDNSFDDRQLERNMPEFLSLPERYMSYNILECGIINVKNTREDKSIEKTYIGIYALLPQGTMIATEVMMIPVYEERVDEQGLVKHVYYNNGKGLRCVETIGMSNIDIDVLSILEMYEVGVGEKIWEMVSSSIQKLDEKDCRIRNKNGRWYIHRAYEIFKNVPGNEIKMDIEFNNEECVDSRNKIEERICMYSPFYGETCGKKEVDMISYNVLKLGINVNIRRSCIPRKILDDNKYTYVSNRSSCMPIFKCGRILQYEDMLLLPCGRVTTARNKLLHLHGCTTVRVFDRQM